MPQIFEWVCTETERIFHPDSRPQTSCSKAWFLSNSGDSGKYSSLEECASTGSDSLGLYSKGWESRQGVEKEKGKGLSILQYTSLQCVFKSLTPISFFEVEPFVACSGLVPSQYIVFLYWAQHSLTPPLPKPLCSWLQVMIILVQILEPWIF